MTERTRVPLQPYYDVDGITIYHTDCLDVLPDIDPDDVDLLLTDPPYGIAHKASDFWDGATIEGDDQRFDPTHLLRFSRLVLWGANHFCQSLPETNGWIVWDKRDQTSKNLPGSDAEMAWTNVTKSTAIYRQVWMPHTIRGEPLLHPTQKPVGLMRWILEQWTESGDLILDPYMGSGPVAEACRDLGRRYVGIEMLGDYCQTAVDRLAQQALPLEAS